MNNNLALRLAASATQHGQRAALRQGDLMLSYAEVDDAAARVTGLLGERGVQPGDRRRVHGPQCPYFAFVYYGRGYKYPRQGWFVEQFPKGATGKLLNREIKAPADIAAGLGR